MCFVWISEQTAIISLYNINWLVYITEMESVYCAVRTQYIIQLALLYKRLSIPKALTKVPAARLLNITDAFHFDL